MSDETLEDKNKNFEQDSSQMDPRIKPEDDKKRASENDITEGGLFKKGGKPPETEEHHTSLTLDAVYDVPVQVSAVLGRVTMPVSQLLKLGRGAVVELDRRVGETVDIYVNNRLVARGEVVIMEDRLGVTMTEILRSEH